MNDNEILITGANGQLGTALRQQYPGARATNSSELDITDSNAVVNFDWSGIKVIINAAAYTNVDGAETAEGRVAAWKVNATGVANLAAAARAHDLTLVHISSEYVFDGTREHAEHESFSPLSVYGASKAAGDIAASSVDKHYIVRTSWVIGEGKNFVRIMLSLADKDIKPSVVSDQNGRLTFTTTLVGAVDHLLASSAAHGTYNVSNDGPVSSWADVASRVYELSGKSTNNVTSVTTDEYFKDKPDAAKRPLNSILDLTKIKSAGFTPTDWHHDLEAYIKQERSRN